MKINSEKNLRRIGPFGVLLLLGAASFVWFDSPVGSPHLGRSHPLDAFGGENAPHSTLHAGSGGEAKSAVRGKLDLRSLSAPARQAFEKIETVLRAGDVNGAESVFRKCLPDLLGSGCAPSVERLLTEAPPGALHETLLRLVEISWPKVDPNAALAWAAALADPTERQDANERLLASLATVDPERAVRLSVAGNDAGERHPLTTSLISSWAASDFQASREWALGLPPGQTRDDCVAAIAEVEARSFPVDAANFALKRLPAGPVLDETVIAIVYQWSGRNAAEARRWVEAFPEGALRERALHEVNGTVADASNPMVVGNLDGQP